MLLIVLKYQTRLACRAMHMWLNLHSRTQHGVERGARAEINTAQQGNDHSHAQLRVKRDAEAGVDFGPAENKVSD